jgi:hypothetical protein
LAAVAVTGVLLAVFVWGVRLRSRQYLESQGWQFEPFADGWKASKHGTPTLPDEQLRMLAADKSIRALDFGGRTTAEQAHALGSMTQLESLSISGFHFEQAHFDAFSHLSRLESLSLFGRGVDAEGLEKLSRLKRLRELRLNSAPFEPGEFAAIGRLWSLENLEVFCDRLTAAELAHLLELPRLRRVQFYYHPFIDAQMFAEFGRMKSLRELDISGAQEHDSAALESLRRLRPDLRIIIWMGCIDPSWEIRKGHPSK